MAASRSCQGRLSPLGQLASLLTRARTTEARNSRWMPTTSAVPCGDLVLSPVTELPCDTLTYALDTFRSAPIWLQRSAHEVRQIAGLAATTFTSVSSSNSPKYSRKGESIVLALSLSLKASSKNPSQAGNGRESAVVRTMTPGSAPCPIKQMDMVKTSSIVMFLLTVRLKRSLLGLAMFSGQCSSRKSFNTDVATAVRALKSLSPCVASFPARTRNRMAVGHLTTGMK